MKLQLQFKEHNNDQTSPQYWLAQIKNRKNQTLLEKTEVS
jgi:hypothetical protein